jgi:hypothetical protein
MSQDPKLTSGKGSMEQRIANRLKPSNAPGADHTVHQGSGPTRTVTTVHHGANHTKPQDEGGQR